MYQLVSALVEVGRVEVADGGRGSCTFELYEPRDDRAPVAPLGGNAPVSAHLRNSSRVSSGVHVVSAPPHLFDHRHGTDTSDSDDQHRSLTAPADAFPSSAESHGLRHPHGVVVLSGDGLMVRPGGGLVVVGSGLEAAVQDPDQPDFPPRCRRPSIVRPMRRNHRRPFDTAAPYGPRMAPLLDRRSVEHRPPMRRSVGQPDRPAQ